MTNRCRAALNMPPLVGRTLEIASATVNPTLVRVPYGQGYSQVRWPTPYGQDAQQLSRMLEAVAGGHRNPYLMTFETAS